MGASKVTMQTNTSAIVSAIIALAIVLGKALVPAISTQLDALSPLLVDIIVILLSAYAGLNTATRSQIERAQKVV